MPLNLANNTWSNVQLEFRNKISWNTKIEVFDHYPSDSKIKFLPRTVILEPNKLCSIEYRIRPTKRGDAKFALTELLISSPLRFWRRSFHAGKESTVRVYPNFAAISHYKLLAIDNHTGHLGVKKRQSRGEGLEFNQLRDYRQGDSLRQIDWKATARRQKLISREYQDERDQQIFFMIDCGRRMRTRDGDLSHFDHALNAMLLLSYVALKQGDAVGLMSFGSNRRWLPLQKGRNAVNAVLNAVYDLHPTTHAQDYLTAAHEFMSRQVKRSLVILTTNYREENVDDLLLAMQLLKRKHLVLLVNLREEIIDNTLLSPVTTFDEALVYSSAANYLSERNEAQKLIRQQNILTLDVLPSKLTTNLINSYFEIKRSRYL
jgi:uncharacterized protein (DUF58 family)